MEDRTAFKNAARLVAMAYEMLDVVRSVQHPKTHEPIEIRIGIHTGSLVAGNAIRLCSCRLVVRHLLGVELTAQTSGDSEAALHKLLLVRMCVRLVSLQGSSAQRHSATTSGDLTYWLRTRWRRTVFPVESPSLRERWTCCRQRQTCIWSSTGWYRYEARLNGSLCP
jgi:hypothetical protein